VGPGRGRSEFGQAGAEVEGCWEGKKGKENGRGDLLFSFLGEESFLFFSGLGWDLAWDLGWAGTGWKKEKGKWARNLFFSFLDSAGTWAGRGRAGTGWKKEKGKMGEEIFSFLGAGLCTEGDLGWEDSRRKKGKMGKEIFSFLDTAWNWHGWGLNSQWGLQSRDLERVGRERQGAGAHKKCFVE